MINRTHHITKVLFDLKLSEFVLNQIKKHLQKYNFTEIQTPIIENSNDITSAIINAYKENKIDQQPWKTYTFGPIFYKEKTQHNHFTRLNQMNIEIINSTSTMQDVYLIKMLDVFFHETMKLENYICKLNFIGDSKDRKSKTNWTKLKDALNLLSVSFVVDQTLDCEFEFSSRELGTQKVFCNGNSYLKENFNGISAEINWDRLLMLIEKNQNKLAIPQAPTLNVIIPTKIAQHQLALLLANELQNNGTCVDVFLEKNSIENLIKKTNKLGAKFALILGEDEQKNGTVSIKNMQTGQTTIVKQVEACKILKN
jgi:histidyl-tRNA synthetase